jgi:hypothetical protein
MMRTVYGSGFRNLFDPVSGMDIFGSGIDIPDPQHCPTQLTTFLFWSPDVSSCRYWLRSEQLLVWLEALADAGVVWLETLAAACLVWGLNSCRYSLRPKQQPVWSEWAVLVWIAGLEKTRFFFQKNPAQWVFLVFCFFLVFLGYLPRREGF